MARRSTPSTAAALATVSLAVALLAGGALPAQAVGSGIETLAAKPTRLKDYEAIFGAVPAPGDEHRYRYATTTSAWSVVAVDPLSTGDLDLRLYTDKKAEELVKVSAQAPGRTEFIAVDSNHRAFDDFFPRVENVDDSGSGTYDVQLAQGADVLGIFAQEISTEDNEIVAVRDTYLEAGKTYRFLLSPGSALMRGDLYLVSSQDGIASTWVKSRAQADLEAVGATGQTTTLQVTAPRTDWYGLVVVRQGVPGTSTLTRVTL